MASKKGRAPTKGTFKPGPDPRRHHNGSVTQPVAQFRRALRELIAEEGNKKHAVTNQISGEQVTLTKIEWVVIAAYNAAVTGDAKAREWISERVEGKVSQPLTIENMTEAERFEYIRGLLARSGFVLEPPEGDGVQGQGSGGKRAV